MDRLAAIAAFDHVVAGGSFTAAARVLQVTPSAVTKAIGKLEAYLKVKLLDRTTHGISLTDEGRLFHERARTVLGWVAETEGLVAERHAKPAGRVRIGTLYGIGRWLVVSALGRLRQEFPGIDVDLQLSDTLPDLLAERLDIAVILGEPPSRSRLFSRTVATTRRITVGAPAYLTRHGTPRVLDDLVAHDCLAHVFDGRPQPWRFRGAGRAQRGREMLPRSVFVTNAGDALREAAVSGLGLAQSNSLLFQKDLDQGTLVEVLPSLSLPGLPVCLVRAPLKPVPLRIRAVEGFLRSLFK